MIAVSFKMIVRDILTKTSWGRRLNMKLLWKEYPSQRHKQLQRLGMENSLAGAETKG